MSERAAEIEALVEELRREAQARRSSAGPAMLPRQESIEEALAAVRGELAAPTPPEQRGSTEALLRLAHPGDAEIHSHRGRLGVAVVAVKGILRRLLTPVLDRQAAFNQEVVEAIVRLEREGARARETFADSAAKLDALAMRLEAIEEALGGSGDALATTAGSFDYGAFEERFRGDRAAVSRALDRYLDLFPAGSGTVLDLGCGRGELLELLRDRGIPAWGVDRSAEAVADAKSRSLDARVGDLARALEGCEDGSLGGVALIQVLEHLPLAKVVRVLDLALRKLRSGRPLVAEVPNLGSLLTFTRAWTLDPTHRQALHPQTLRFLAEQAGFARVEIVHGGEPEPDLLLEGGGDADPAARNVTRLNRLLLGAQDCAIVAWTP